MRDSPESYTFAAVYCGTVSYAGVYSATFTWPYAAYKWVSFDAAAAVQASAFDVG